MIAEIKITKDCIININQKEFEVTLQFPLIQPIKKDSNIKEITIKINIRITDFQTTFPFIFYKRKLYLKIFLHYQFF